MTSLSVLNLRNQMYDFVVLILFFFSCVFYFLFVFLFIYYTVLSPDQPVE